MPRRTTQTHLLVLESSWSGDVSDTLSVAPFVEGFIQWAFRGINAYVRHFYRREELEYWLHDFARRRLGVSRRLVYVASHGSKGRIGGLPNGLGGINFRTFAQIVRHTGRLEGIHLGCCYFGRKRNAEVLLRPDRRRRHHVPCKWIAGYASDIDWLDAMLVDLVFWRFLLEDPTLDAWRAAERTYNHAPAARTLKFAVFKNGPGGILLNSLKDLAAEPT